ncbi:MAG: type II toxin-antitoxin system RelE/ParE family toxin [Chloroflexi bacterium]|nr:type II toxin-antitoxin system RelE/ParE family toxin [Chloroflexota bacterium]
MAQYRLEVLRPTARELEALPTSVSRRVAEALDKLINNPRPRQSRKMRGSESSYRLRVGDYRVLYQVGDTEGLIQVYAIRHRREAYR